MANNMVCRRGTLLVLEASNEFGNYPEIPWINVL